MFLELALIFINVITPVFALVVIGYFAGPPLNLNARTLTRFAYYILVPAFVFNVVSVADIQVSLVTQMIIYILLVHIGVALIGFSVAKLLRRSAEMVAAYVMVAVFGNVGNFGVPIIKFRLGEEAMLAATVYFLAILTISFIVAVAAANWSKGGGIGAMWAVFKTPALIALVPSILVNWVDIQPPLVIMRITDLLAGAMIPTMLVALGVQLAGVKKFHFSSDVVISSSIRLLIAPALALLLAIPFGLTGVERGAAVFHSAMPAAVLTSIIAIEYDLLPNFITTVVLFSTLVSVVTLTLVLAFV